MIWVSLFHEILHKSERRLITILFVKSLSLSFDRAIHINKTHKKP